LISMAQSSFFVFDRFRTKFSDSGAVLFEKLEIVKTDKGLLLTQKEEALLDFLEESQKLNLEGGGVKDFRFGCPALFSQSSHSKDSVIIEFLKVYLEIFKREIIPYISQVNTSFEANMYKTGVFSL